jgi:hypothetical protein
MAVALWAETNGVACGPYGLPTKYDNLAVYRNSGLLKDGNAFIAVGPRKQWPVDVVDLVHRAETIRFHVRFVGG